MSNLERRPSKQNNNERYRFSEHNTITEVNKSGIEIPSSHNNTRSEKSKAQQYKENEDLMSAIKQVAKEMAEAVKMSQHQSQKEAEIAKEIEEKNKAKKQLMDADSDHPEPKGEKVVFKKNSIGGERYSFNYFNDDYDQDGYIQSSNTSRQQTKTYYEREIDAHNNLQHRLELIRNKKIQDELKMCKKKPELSATTKKIIESKLKNEKPIYQRTDEVLRHKELRLQFLKSVFQEIDHMQEEELKSPWNTNGNFDQMKFQQFLSDQMLWQKNKEEKLAYIKDEISKLEEIASKTLYKPAINKQSSEIAKTKQKMTQVHERLHQGGEEKHLNRKKLIEDFKPKFQPTINKYVPRPEKISSKEVGTKAKKNLSRSLVDNNRVNMVEEEEESFSGGFNRNNGVGNSYTNKNNGPKYKNNSNRKVPTNKYDETSLQENQSQSQSQSTLNYANEEMYEDPLIVQYRLTVQKAHLNNSPVRKHITEYKGKMKETEVRKIENNRTKGIEPNWSYEIDKITENAQNILNTNNSKRGSVENEGTKSLYKLNMRSNSAWKQSDENKVIGFFK
jgi:hypothetical protein